MREAQTGEGAVIIGVDVGASSIAGGLVTPDGEVLMHAQTPTRRKGGGDAVERLLSVVADVHAEARRRGLAIQGVGVGLPCFVDVDRGMSVDDQNFVPELAHVPVADRILEQTGLTTWVDNDVNALALGELRWGAGQGRRRSSSSPSAPAWAAPSSWMARWSAGETATPASSATSAS